MLPSFGAVIPLDKSSNNHTSTFMEQTIIDQILNADARALATTGPHGTNVVPVSVIDVVEGCVYLYNFFMGKTIENLLAQPQVALTCWKGLEGIQLKADAAYITTGDQFATAATTMKARFPDRTLSGIIALTPTVVFDISADQARAGKEIFRAA